MSFQQGSFSSRVPAGLWLDHQQDAWEKSCEEFNKSVPGQVREMIPTEQDMCAEAGDCLHRQLGQWQCHCLHCLNSKRSFLTALEAGDLKTQCQPDQVLGSSSWVLEWQRKHHSLHLLVRLLTPLRGPTLMASFHPNDAPGAPLLIMTLQIMVSTHQLERTGTFRLSTSMCLYATYCI